MIKSFTDLEQSKQLAEFLPLESADMCYIQDLLAGCKYGDYKPYIGDLIPAYGQDKIRCWSLAALLEIIPEGQVNRMTSNGKWMAVSWPPEHYYIAKDYDSAVDACYALILGLHNQNIL